MTFCQATFMFGYKTSYLNTQQPQQQHSHNYAEVAAATCQQHRCNIPFAGCGHSTTHTRDTPTFNLQPEVWVCTLSDIPTLTTLISRSLPLTPCQVGTHLAAHNSKIAAATATTIPVQATGQSQQQLPHKKYEKRI